MSEVEIDECMNVSVTVCVRDKDVPMCTTKRQGKRERERDVPSFRNGHISCSKCVCATHHRNVCVYVCQCV